jgi:glutamate-1-semialdehyde 2,1-aminomutase
VPGTYEELERKSATLCARLAEAARDANVPIFQTRVGSMFCTFFTGHEVHDYATARTADTVLFARFFHAMLRRGVHLAPSQFEAGFMSLAHSDEDIEHTIEAARMAMRTMKQVDKETTGHGGHRTLRPQSQDSTSRDAGEAGLHL